MNQSFASRACAFAGAFLLSGCTYTLGTVRPQVGKTADQQSLDTLTCKDQANLAVNNTGRQTGNFLLGLTIVGAPVAMEMDKAKAREVFAECMRGRGYVVIPPGAQSPPGGKSAGEAASAPSAVTDSAVPGVAALSVALPEGFLAKPVQDAWKSNGVLFYSLNRTVDVGYFVGAARHEGITDLASFAQTRRSNQTDRLKDPTASDIAQIEVNGRSAYRFSVSGSLNSVKLTYLITVIGGHDQIVVVTAWSGASNFARQRALIESLAASVSGIS